MLLRLSDWFYRFCLHLLYLITLRAAVTARLNEVERTFLKFYFVFHGGTVPSFRSVLGLWWRCSMFIIRWYTLSSFRERNCRNLFYKLVTEDIKEFLPEIGRGRGMERERERRVCYHGMRLRAMHAVEDYSRAS